MRLTNFVFFIARFALFCAVAFAPRVAFAGANDGLAPVDAPIDQSTPRKSMAGFLDAAHAAQFERAAHYLDLRDTPRAEQSIKGPELARELVYVLDRKSPVDPNKIDEEPDPNSREVVATTLTLDDEHVSISLVRVRSNDGAPPVWIVSRTAVALIPPLYRAFGPKGWEGHMPEILTTGELFGNALWQWIGLLLLVVASYAIGRISSYFVVAVGKFFAKRSATPFDDELIVAARAPFRILFGVAAFREALDALALTVTLQNILDHVTFSLLVIGVGLLVLRVLGVVMGWAVSHLPAEAQYELKRRELRTRFGLLLRIADVVVAVLTTAVILTQFTFVRTVGLSVLASAGIAGVVIGLAAQKSVSSVIAGIQISLTQPIRIGDVVKVEGQSGVVEEVTLTIVTLRLADQRRLIVPVSRFLDQPFENWTKKSSEILGTVTLIVDFAMPADVLRVEAKRLVEENPLWDKRLFKMTIADVTQAGVQVNIVVSASDSNRLTDLRDETREALLKFLQTKEGGAYFISQRTAPAS